LHISALFKKHTMAFAKVHSGYEVVVPYVIGICRITFQIAAYLAALLLT